MSRLASQFTVALRPQQLLRALLISRNLQTLKLLNRSIKTLYCTWSLRHQPQSSKTLGEPASLEMRRSSPLAATLLFNMVFPLPVSQAYSGLSAMPHTLAQALLPDATLGLACRLLLRSNSGSMVPTRSLLSAGRMDRLVMGNRRYRKLSRNAMPPRAGF